MLVVDDEATIRHLIDEVRDPSVTRRRQSGSVGANDDRAVTLELARKLIGVPRHMSQHPGGFVLTHDRLDDLVPIEPAAMEDRQIIEWDKDDIDALKFMKVDVLGLGMLGCMNRAFNMLEADKGLRVGLADLQDDDPDV